MKGTSEKGDYRLDQLLELLQRIEDRLRRNESDREETDREVMSIRQSLDNLEDKYLSTDKTTFDLEQKVHKLEALENKIQETEEKEEQNGADEAKLWEILEEYRQELKDLEERADTTERVYMTLEQKINTQSRDGGLSEDKLEEIEGRIGEREQALRDEIAETKKQIQTTLQEARDKLESQDPEKQQEIITKQEEIDENVQALREVTETLNDRMDTALTKAAGMTERIDDIANQQMRINRRLDKAYQDKVRLERKIERMEEIVTRNQEALQAKALVLLTDSGIAERSNRPFVRPARAMPEETLDFPRSLSPDHDNTAESDKTPGSGNDSKGKEDGKDRTNPQRRRRLFRIIQGTSAAAGVVALLAGGWYITTRIDNATQTGQPKFAQNESAINPPGRPRFDDPVYVAPLKDAQALKEDMRQDGSLNGEEPARPQLAIPRDFSVSDNEQISSLGRDTERRPKNQEQEQQRQNQNQNENPAPDTSPSDNQAQTTQTENEDIASGVKPAQKNEDAQISSSFEEIRKEEVRPEGNEQIAALRPDETNIYPGVEPAAGDAQRDITRNETPAPSDQDRKPVKSLSEFTIPHLDPEQDADLRSVLKEARERVDTLITENNEGSPENRIEPDVTLKPIVKQIENKAFEGVGEAQHDLAAIYTAGHAGTIQNFEKAVFWFREASVNGIANARYNLGVLYHQGLGVRENLERAIDWYRAAAVLDHPEAQYNLGIAHIEGIGTDYKPKLAAYYFTKSALQGIVEAAYNLGLTYENGLIGPPDPEHALFWYSYAAGKGSAEAATAKQQLLENDSIPEPRRQLALQKYAVYYDVEDDPALSDAIEQNNQNKRQESRLVKEIQGVLVDLGLYPGPADGIYGPKTEDAIRSYQKSHDLAVTGQASASLLAHIKANYEIK